MLDQIARGAVSPIPQDHTAATRAPKLTKELGQIDWSRTARQIDCHIRAMQPWPMARTAWWPAGGGKGPVTLIVHRTEVVDESGAPTAPASCSTPGMVLEVEAGRLVVAAAGGGRIRLVQVQIPGKKVMPVAEFLRGHRVEPGDRLGAEPGA